MRPESLLLLFLMGGLLFLMFSRTRRQQREVQRTQAGLAPGAEIMTASGLFATVIEIQDQVVVLETAPGQRSRWDRRAVARIIPPTSPEPVGEPVTGEDGEPDTPPERG